MNKDKSEQTRLLIATFIVAATLATMNLSFPSSIADNPIVVALFGAPGLGLILSSLGAFIYVLSVGYGLTYGSRQSAMQEKIKKWSYNFSVKAFLPTVFITSIVYLYSWGGLHSSPKMQPIFNVALYLIGILIFIYLERHQIKDIYSYWRNAKSRE